MARQGTPGLGERIAAILLLTAIVSGCVLDGDTNEPRISNESGVAVEILWTGPGGDEVHYTNIAPGQATGLYTYPVSCAPNAMVARTADGQEVARTEEPLCPGDLWVIPTPPPVPDSN
jgi:hypothetical protein